MHIVDKLTFFIFKGKQALILVPVPFTIPDKDSFTWIVIL